MGAPEEHVEDALLAGDPAGARQAAERALQAGMDLGAMAVLAATSPPRRAQRLLAQLQRMAPNDPRVLRAHARVALLLGDGEQALRAALRARASAPGALSHGCLAGVLGRLGQHEGALGVWIEATQLAPADPRTWRWAAAGARAGGDEAHALRLLRGGCAACPGDGPLHAELGRALLAAGECAAAVGPLERAVALGAEDAVVWHNLGVARRRAGDLTGSLRAARAATARSDAAGVRLGLAHAHAALGHAQAARLALGDQDDVAACVLRGRLAFEAGDREEALAQAARALAQAPREPKALRLQALSQPTLVARRRDLERAVAVDPAFGAALADLVFVRRTLADWDGLAALDARLDVLQAQAMARGERGPEPPMQHLCRSTDAAATLALARSWAPRVAPRPPVPPHEGVLRVGYLTADVRPHAMAWLLEGLFAAHDRARVHVTLFALGPRSDAPIAASMRAGADAVVDLGLLPDTMLAERIRAANLHVLVDLMGHTDGNRLRALALRPAPIQATWLGYPASSGSPAIDYVVLDEILAPSGQPGPYSERVARLPCYQANGPLHPVAPPPPRSALGLPAAGPVLASLNRTEKLDRNAFVAWMRVLDAVPDATLWLLAGHPVARDNLRREASRAGVDPARLVFAGTAPHDDHLARLQQVTLGLDPFVYGAHTTASDLLRVGAPVLTLRGPSVATRVAASLLSRCGVCDALVVSTVEDYVARAVELLRDPARLDAVRSRLVAGRGALFSPAHTARALERCFADWVAQAHAEDTGPHASAAGPIR